MGSQGQRVRRAAVCAIAAALLAVTGCATGQPAPSPTAIQSNTSVPSASPTPDVAPMGRLPIACDSVVSPAIRDRLLGVGSEPEVWRGVAGWRQGGMSQCAWQGESGRLIQVWILADAASAYVDAMVAVQGARPPGDRSGACSEDFEQRAVMCGLTGLAGGYWYEVASTTALGAPETLDSLAQTLHDEVGGALSTAGTPLPPWVPAAAAADLGTSCLPYDGPEFRAAAGPSVGPVEQWVVELPTSLIFEAARRSGELVCFWSDIGTPTAGAFEVADLQGVTGSGWSWIEVVDGWNAQWEGSGDRMEPVEVPGADAAFANCRPGLCLIEVLVADTVFSGRFERYDSGEVALDRVIAASAAWVAVLRSS